MRKNRTERPASTNKTPRRPLKVNKDSLKDLTPETRTIQQVKGGKPLIPD